jgi:hypothetical protein
MLPNPVASPCNARTELADHYSFLLDNVLELSRNKVCHGRLAPLLVGSRIAHSDFVLKIIGHSQKIAPRIFQENREE